MLSLDIVKALERYPQVCGGFPIQERFTSWPHLLPQLPCGETEF